MTQIWSTITLAVFAISVKAFSDLDLEDLCPGATVLPELSFTNGKPVTKWDFYAFGYSMANSIRLRAENSSQSISFWNKNPFTLKNFLIEADVQHCPSQNGNTLHIILANDSCLTRQTTSPTSSQVYAGVNWANCNGLSVATLGGSDPGKRAPHPGRFCHAGNCSNFKCSSTPCTSTTAISATHQIRIIETNAGSSNLTVHSCYNDSATSWTCNDAIVNTLIPQPVLSSAAPGKLFFGMGIQYNPSPSLNTVDIFNVTVYNCTSTIRRVTTTSPTTSTSAKTFTISTSKYPSAAIGQQTAGTTKVVTNGKTSPPAAKSSPNSEAVKRTAGTTIVTKPTASTKVANNFPNGAVAEIGTTIHPPTSQKADSTIEEQPYTKAQSRSAGMIAEKVQSLEGSSLQLLQKSFFVDYQDNVSKPSITVDELLQECGDFAPNRAAPPTSNTGPITFVKPAFAVERFHEIDTVSETITVSGIMLLSWSITSCPVNSSDLFTRRPPELLHVTNSGEVWTPGYRYKAASSTIYMQNDDDDFDEDLVAIMRKETGAPNRTLDFYWIKDGSFVSTCQLHLANFPFDEQSCMFAFSLMRSTSLVSFTDEQFLWPDKPGTESETSEWKYVSHESRLSTLYYRGQPTSSVYFFVTMKRNPWYYTASIILPNAALSIVEFGSFVLPPSVPDRPAFSVTILLAMTVAQSTISTQIPRVSQRILLVDFVSTLLWLCAFCTLYHLAACCYAVRLENMSDKMQPEKLTRAFKIVRICDVIVALVSFGVVAGYNTYLYINTA